MSQKTSGATIPKWLAGAAGLAVTTYAACVAHAWLQYARPDPAGAGEDDELLDRFMPTYDIVERHRIRVSAPPEVTLAVAGDADLLQSPIARAVFRAREVILGSDADRRSLPRGLLALTRSIGWGELGTVPGREIVMGAVTQPWEANVVFRALPPHDFAAFNEPGFVKIAWTLRADSLGAGASMFRTETRAVATDATARLKFRRYWSLVSPGIILIRWMMLGPVKAEAERRAAIGVSILESVEGVPRMSGS
jgi:hypothetical protein